MTITEFLLARIAEDEAAAKACEYGSAQRWRDDEYKGNGGTVWNGLGQAAATNVHENGAHIARHDPARVLAECAAKRAIVEAQLDSEACGDNQSVEAITGCLGALAAVYKDHPDYRQEWAV